MTTLPYTRPPHLRCPFCQGRVRASRGTGVGTPGGWYYLCRTPCPRAGITPLGKSDLITTKQEEHMR